MIHANSNDTKTTVVNNTSNNTIPTAINQILAAQNVTSIVNIVKENTTTPIYLQLAFLHKDYINRHIIDVQIILLIIHQIGNIQQ